VTVERDDLLAAQGDDPFVWVVPGGR